MKPTIRTPYFEVGVKNYIYGDTVLEYAIAADKAAEKYDIDVLFIAPAVEIRRICENTKHLIVLAPYMDTLRPGRGMADVLPEGLKAAGAKVAGVVLLVDRSGGKVKFGRIPMFSLMQMTPVTWEPSECPLCKAGGKPCHPGS